MTTHKEFMASLPKKRRAVIRARAAELLAEEITLQELRKARDHSQETTAEALGLKQHADFYASRICSGSRRRARMLRPL